MTDEEKDRITRAEEIQLYTENRCSSLEKENAELKWQLNEVIEDNDYYQEENKRLDEDNKELKAHCKAVDEVNEKMKCCGNCINRGLEKYSAYPCNECRRWHRELDSDRWELAE